MAKKVGIITFHRAINYGALLQSYALWKTLDDMGADVRVIDYRNEFIETLYLPTWGLKKTYDGLKSWAPTAPLRVSKTNKFRRFSHREMRLTKACDRETVAQTVKGYDALITGSDQVFNPPLSQRDKAYYLDFAPDSAKRYSYAASLGPYRYDTSGDADFIGLLDQMECISVRESSAIDEIGRISSTEVRIDADPTMLLAREAWNSLLPSERIRQNPYVFCYSVDPFTTGFEQAKRYASEVGCDLVFLHNRITDARPVDSDGTILLHDSSPYDWLRLIRDAECIFTNSFHGSVFCTIFNKPFMSEVQSRRGFSVRIWRLLLDAGLQDRIVEHYTLDAASITDGVAESIDWASVNEHMASKRNESLRYLARICE